MTTLQLPVLKPAPSALEHAGPRSVMLVGPPNVGKTCLFNAWTGLRARTANFAGTTVDYRVARTRLGQDEARVIDLPGLYSLEPTGEDERVAARAVMGLAPDLPEADAVVLVVDATRLERGLFLAGEVLELGRPTVVAVNLIDAARSQGVRVDVDALSRRLGCSVVPVSARTGEGLDDLRRAVCDGLRPDAAGPCGAAAGCAACGGCRYTARYAWAEDVASACRTTERDAAPRERRTDAIDGWLTHPIVGAAAFLLVMAGLFYVVFALAEWPMGLIEAGFAHAGAAAESLVPEGDLRSFVVDGVIGGAGGVLVFLPQIVILFFLLTLLEDSGYLARAAVVMDRWMRFAGLPGKAFVPMLSAHACAVPAIMATRIIEDRRDRLATILVLPLFSCTARLPVYVILVALLFGGRPALAAAAFTGAYALGIAAAILTALVIKRGLMRSPATPLVIELPDYRLPSLGNALFTCRDRAWTFIRKTGTTILLLSMFLWAMATYPKLDPGATAGLDAAAAAQAELAHSFAGRVGRAVEPVFAPLGFNWQIDVGVLASFAAREVIVSTLAVVYGAGDTDDTGSLVDTLRAQTDASGEPVFTAATCLSLLVFYVLAMQCLPTSVLVRRETGSWKWAALQFGYLSVLAYVAAMATYQVASWLA